MGQFVIASSTNVVAGDDVRLTITISQNDTPFELGVLLTVYDVFNIIDKEATPSVQFKKSSDTPSPFIYNEDNFTYKTNPKLKLKFFDIIIKGKRNPSFQSSATLKIDILTKEGATETILFEVGKPDNPIAIKVFKASSNIIQKNKQNLDLSYKIDGEGVELKLLENAKIVNCDLSKQSVRIDFDGKFPGLYEYTLEAKKGNQTVSKSIPIIYLEDTTIKERTVPENRKIINFCIAQEENYLYALMYSKTEDIFEIGLTEQIEGKNTWSIINITNQKTIRLFATSPMVHLQSDNEKNEGNLGKLYFIGGSRLGHLGEEPDEIANQVAIIDLDDKKDNIQIHYPTKTSKNGPKLSAKFGHTCILFPKGTDTNTIWMLGGQDKYGKPSNEVLTSPDGLIWTLQTETSPWSARVMLSASASWRYEGEKIKKDALWLSGGFEEFAGFGGGFQDDVWKFDKNGWKKITPDQTVINKNSLASAIAYGGVKETGDTGLFVFGNTQDKKTYFLNLNKNNDDKYVLKNNVFPELSITHFNQGCYITAFFRECMWVMGLYDAGSEGVTYSDLYYRIPTIHEETINFYNNK